MARSYYSARSRRRRRTHSLYLAGAVIIVGLVAYFLFWGDSPAPQDASAGEDSQTRLAAGEPAREVPPLAAEADPPQPQAVPARPERTNQSLPQMAGQPAPSPRVARQEATLPVTQRVVEPTVKAPEFDHNADAERAVAAAMALLNTGPRQVIAARDKLNETLALNMPAAQRKAVKVEMAKLSEEWLFGPSAFAGDKL